MLLNEDTFHMKVVALNENYNFIVLSFYIWDRMQRKINIIFQQHNNRVLALVALEK
jgi:hypothetical protein